MTEVAGAERGWESCLPGKPRRAALNFSRCWAEGGRSRLGAAHQALNFECKWESAGAVYHLESPPVSGMRRWFLGEGEWVSKVMEGERNGMWLKPERSNVPLFKFTLTVPCAAVQSTISDDYCWQQVQ